MNSRETFENFSYFLIFRILNIFPFFFFFSTWRKLQPPLDKWKLYENVHSLLVYKTCAPRIRALPGFERGEGKKFERSIIQTGQTSFYPSLWNSRVTVTARHLQLPPILFPFFHRIWDKRPPCIVCVCVYMYVCTYENVFCTRTSSRVWWPVFYASLTGQVLLLTFPPLLCLASLLKLHVITVEISGEKYLCFFSLLFLPCLALPRCNDERSCAEIIVRGIIKAGWNSVAWIRVDERGVFTFGFLLLHVLPT